MLKFWYIIPDFPSHIFFLDHYQSRICWKFRYGSHRQCGCLRSHSAARADRLIFFLPGPEDLTEMARCGVTTAFDMATWLIELLASPRGQKDVTDIQACCLPATAPGSTHSKFLTHPHEALTSNAIGSKRFVDGRLAEGADYIKVVADVLGPDHESINALVINAHMNDKLVIFRAINLTATHMAQIAGADVITYTPLDGVMSDAEVHQVNKDKRISIPTLVVINGAAQGKNMDFGNSRKTAHRKQTRIAIPCPPGVPTQTCRRSPLKRI